MEGLYDKNCAPPLIQNLEYNLGLHNNGFLLSARNTSEDKPNIQ